MIPIFFRANSLYVTSSDVAKILAVLFSLWLTIMIDKKQKMGLGTLRICMLYVYMIPVYSIGIRLAYCIVYLHEISVESLLCLNNNFFKSGDGALFAILFLFVASKFWRYPLLHLLDIVSFVAMGAAAFLRIGCFLSNCCRGATTNGSFSIHYPDYNLFQSPTFLDLILGRRWGEYSELFKSSDPAYYPYSLIFALGCLIIFGFLHFNRAWIKSHPGRIFSLALILFGALRILTEVFFRSNPPYFYNKINIVVILAILYLLYGTVQLIMLTVKQRQITDQ